MALDNTSDIPGDTPGNAGDRIVSGTDDARPADDGNIVVAQAEGTQAAPVTDSVPGLAAGIPAPPLVLDPEALAALLLAISQGQVAAVTAIISLTGAVNAGETVNYASGTMALEGYKAPAKGTSKGMVLVIHDWDGLTDYERKRADMLAGMGYDAFAVDL